MLFECLVNRLCDCLWHFGIFFFFFSKALASAHLFSHKFFFSLMFLKSRDLIKQIAPFPICSNQMLFFFQPLWCSTDILFRTNPIRSDPISIQTAFKTNRMIRTNFHWQMTLQSITLVRLDKHAKTLNTPFSRGICCCRFLL